MNKYILVILRAMFFNYDMNKIINHLQQEQGTASNIKSASTNFDETDNFAVTPILKPTVPNADTVSNRRS